MEDPHIDRETFRDLIEKIMENILESDDELVNVDQVIQDTMFEMGLTDKHYFTAIIDGLPLTKSEREQFEEGLVSDLIEQVKEFDDPHILIKLRDETLTEMAEVMTALRALDPLYEKKVMLMVEAIFNQKIAEELQNDEEE